MRRLRIKENGGIGAIHVHNIAVEYFVGEGNEILFYFTKIDGNAEAYTQFSQVAKPIIFGIGTNIGQGKMYSALDVSDDTAIFHALDGSEDRAPIASLNIMDFVD